MMNHARIIEAIGVEALTRETGATANAIAVWKHRNRIPAKYWVLAARAAKSVELDVSLAQIAGLEAPE